MAHRTARCFAAALPGAGHAGFLPMKTSPLRRAFHALCLGLIPVFALAAESAAFFSALSFDAAREKAAAENKIVFIDFYTTWCGPCKELDATTWQDAAVVALLSEKAISLKIDAEKERDLARRYKVSAYPTLLLLKSDGTEIDRLVGYRDAVKFTGEFNAGLAGKSALQRARDAVTNAPNEHDRVQARYRLGDELARSGHPDEALAEYLWCYDKGMVRVPSFTGVRVSFLLSSIQNLARSYAPAKTALTERRDRAKAQFLQGETAVTFELAALNNALEDRAANLALFNQLKPGDERRTALSRNLFDQLLADRRYREALEGLSSASLERQWQNMQQLQNRAGKSERQAATERKFLRHWLAARIEAFAGAGSLDDARHWIEIARASDDSPELATEIRRRLKRAGHPELLPE